MSHLIHHSSSALRTVRRSAFAALLATAAMTLFAHGAIASDLSDYSMAQPEGSSLSRSEVIADLHLWQRAGMDQVAIAHSYQVDEAAYRSAFAEYQRLRNGPAFASEVARVAAARGELVTHARQ